MLCFLWKCIEGVQFVLKRSICVLILKKGIVIIFVDFCVFWFLFLFLFCLSSFVSFCLFFLEFINGVCGLDGCIVGEL